MAAEFEFISTSDKPALLVLTTPEFITASKTALTGLGYKVQAVTNHDDFISRFAQIQYQVVVFEELFNASLPSDNKALVRFQWMPMGQRRHTTSFLIGNFQTMNAMLAYHQSVNAVINSADLSRVAEIVRQVTADNELFLSMYRDTQIRIAQGKA